MACAVSPSAVRYGLWYEGCISVIPLYFCWGGGLNLTGTGDVAGNWKFPTSGYGPLRYNSQKSESSMKPVPWQSQAFYDEVYQLCEIFRSSHGPTTSAIWSTFVASLRRKRCSMGCRAVMDRRMSLSSMNRAPSAGSLSIGYIRCCFKPCGRSKTFVTKVRSASSTSGQ